MNPFACYGVSLFLCHLTLGLVYFHVDDETADNHTLGVLNFFGAFLYLIMLVY
jgi:hypothetical protein